MSESLIRTRPVGLHRLPDDSKGEKPFAGVAEIKRLVAISGVSLLSLWFGLSA